MKRKEKDDLFAARIPGVLQYHQLMLSDGVRNKLLYEAIQKHVTPETNFLDVGAGTGVWAILAAKMGAKRVVAIEIEECLIPIIYRHAKENGVANKIEIIHGNSDDVKIRGKFDVIVSELFGGDAMGEATVNSFVALRKRFLAPDGILIPQKLAMFVAPARVEKAVQHIPSELPIECSFLKSVRLNYGTNLSFSQRDRIHFLAPAQKLLEMDFRTVESAAPLKNLSATWKMDNLHEANALVLFNQSTFTDELIMDSFHSQSWGTTIYEFQPFTADSGEIKINLTLEGKNTVWAVSLTSNPEIKTQNYSPVFAFTRLRMAQKTTPHRKFKPPKTDKESDSKTKIKG